LLGLARAQLGRYEQAREQGRAALALARGIGHRPHIGRACWLLGYVALAEDAYAEARDLFQESAVHFRELGRGEELSWACTGLGYAHRGLGQIPQARQYLSDALQIFVEKGSSALTMAPLLALVAIALILADAEKERAVELYALASRYPFVANSRWVADVAGKRIAALAATLPPDVLAAAQERGRARDLETTVVELLVELE
jgi:tetratricopeptide (TPR) repeat protein